MGTLRTLLNQNQSLSWVPVTCGDLESGLLVLLLVNTCLFFRSGLYIFWWVKVTFRVFVKKKEFKDILHLKTYFGLRNHSLLNLKSVYITDFKVDQFGFSFHQREYIQSFKKSSAVFIFVTPSKNGMFYGKSVVHIFFPCPFEIPLPSSLPALVS